MMDHEAVMDEGLASMGDPAHEERNTRASRWSMHETLVLIAGKKKEMEDDRDAKFRGRITHDSNKWSLIAHFCNEHGVHRDPSQCKKRWHSLYTEYKKIKDNERLSGVESYWLMSADKRRESALAPMFEREVFDQMNSFLSRTPKLMPDSAFDSVAPDAVGVADLDGTGHSQGSSMEMGGGLRSGAVGAGHRKRQRRRIVSHEDVPEQKLVAVLENNGKAMQAELAADRELRKEQGRNLIAVFDKLADGLGQIASAIHNLKK